ncbi:MAG: L-rhamnose/proton symporter RhaT [Bacteroidota bacterium]
MDVFTGVMFHAIGASSAALCYTPQRQVKRWSWQTYWLAQAFVCWLLLPIVIAWLTIPQLMQVLKEAPAPVMLKTFLMGAAYGIGGTAFGIAIRYVGFSLTYAISVGISCVLGTLLPPFVQGQLETVMQQHGAQWLAYGITLGALGIILCGVAGRWKEKQLLKNNNSASFSLAKGLPICILSGILSAVYGFSISEGQPIADIAARYGAGNFQGNVIYIFSNSGAFLSTMIYCFYLHVKGKTFKEYASTGFDNTKPKLSNNYLLAALTGILWYGQFFFYGLGHVRMGTYKFSSWAIHMIMLVLFSALAGILLKEWIRINAATTRLLAIALVVLIGAVVLLTYGNYLGASNL